MILHPNRDELRDLLRQAGVETGIHYPILPSSQEAYRSLATSKIGTPQAKTIVDSCLSLPIGPTMSKSEASSVVSLVNTAIKTIEAKM